MKEAQQRQKDQFDRRVSDKEFQVGQEVLISTRHMGLKDPKSERKKKLLPKYMGPYRVGQRVGPVAYKVQLPSHMQMHNVFHVSLLKDHHYDGRHRAEPPAVELIQGEEHHELDKVIGERKFGRGGKYTQLLVRWKDGDESWEFEEDLLEDAPEFAPQLIAEYRATQVRRAAS